MALKGKAAFGISWRGVRNKKVRRGGVGRRGEIVLSY